MGLGTVYDYEPVASKKYMQGIAGFYDDMSVDRRLRLTGYWIAVQSLVEDADHLTSKIPHRWLAQCWVDRCQGSKTRDEQALCATLLEWVTFRSHEIACDRYIRNTQAGYPERKVNEVQSFANGMLQISDLYELSNLNSTGAVTYKNGHRDLHRSGFISVKLVPKMTLYIFVGFWTLIMTALTYWGIDFFFDGVSFEDKTIDFGPVYIGLRGTAIQFFLYLVIGFIYFQSLKLAVKEARSDPFYFKPTRVEINSSGRKFLDRWQKYTQLDFESYLDINDSNKSIYSEYLPNYLRKRKH